MVSHPLEMPPVTSWRVFRIAVPMMIAFMSTPLLGIVDTAVVGHIGVASLSGGVAVGALFFELAYSFESFLRTGTTALTAQALGRGNAHEQSVVMARALVVALACGLLILLFSNPLISAAMWLIGPDQSVQEAATLYIKARLLSAPLTPINYAVLGWILGKGKSGLGLALQTLLNGANMLLSILLVAGLQWGVAGAGYATSLAELITAITGLVWVYGYAPRPLPQWGEVFRLKAFTEMMSVNRDIMIRTLSLIVAFSLFTRVGAGQGDVVLAANAVLMQFFMLGGFFLDGFANAAEQMTGQSIGAKHEANFRAAVQLSLIWGYISAGVLSLALVIWGRDLIAIMTGAPEVRAAAERYLLWAAITPLTGVLAFGMDGVFFGATWGRDLRNMMLLSLVFFVACLAVLPNLWGNAGLWLAFNAFLMMRGVSLALCYPRRIAAAFVS